MSANVAGHELAGRWIKRDLAAEKEQTSSPDSGGKGSYRRRDPVGRDYLSTHVIDLLPRLKSSVLRSSMRPPSGDLSEGSSRIDPRSARFRSKSSHSAVNRHHHGLFCPNVWEAAPKAMSRRPGTPPRLLALFVLIRPNLGDRLAVIAPGFGGDFLHDDKKRQDRSSQN